MRVCVCVCGRQDLEAIFDYHPKISAKQRPIKNVDPHVDIAERWRIRVAAILGPHTQALTAAWFADTRVSIVDILHLLPLSFLTASITTTAIFNDFQRLSLILERVFNDFTTILRCLCNDLTMIFDDFLKILRRLFRRLAIF